MLKKPGDWNTIRKSGCFETGIGDWRKRISTKLRAAWAILNCRIAWVAQSDPFASDQTKPNNDKSIRPFILFLIKPPNTIHSISKILCVPPRFKVVMLVGSRTIQRWEQVRVLLVTVGMPAMGVVDPALSAVSLCSTADEASFIPHLEVRLHHVSKANWHGVSNACACAQGVFSLNLPRYFLVAIQCRLSCS